MASRRDLFDPSDPEQLRPEQRLVEVAAILAAGVIRMRGQCGAALPKVRLSRNSVCSTGSAAPLAARGISKIPPESGGNCLELLRRTRPDGQCG